MIAIRLVSLMLGLFALASMNLRTGTTMLSNAKTWVGDRYPVGMCQKWTRLRFGVPTTGPDAHSAWRSARKRVTAGASSIPRYAATYMTGGNHGHACISLGGGRIISTDAHRSGFVGITTLAALERKWGYRTAGYVVVDGNGNTLFKKPSPIKKVVKSVTSKLKVGNTTLTVYRIDAGQGDVWRVKRGHKANFRKLPSATAPVTTTKRAGAEFRFVRKVRNGGRLWLMTADGNWANSNVFDFVRE